MKAGMILSALLTMAIGAGLIALAVYQPHIPGARITSSPSGLMLGGGICIATGLVLVIFSFIMGRALGVNDQVLTTGLPATAVIKAVRETGLTLQNGMYVMLDFNLEVGPGTGSPYQVTCRSMVPRISLSMVGIGKIVVVKVDPSNQNHVVIDWSSVPS
jgi:hypothetical protein